MKKIIFILLAYCHTSCGQIGKHSHKNSMTMDTNLINNSVAQSAFKAWQSGDINLWLSHFTTNVKLLDDGRNRDFLKFSSEAIGHERFLSIDKVEENGTAVFGHFHSDTWGDFKTYFRFHINQEGEIYQLDIGQANY